MKQKTKGPAVPVEMHDTVRRGILSELGDGLRSAKDLSGAIGIPQREVYGHLSHIGKTLGASGGRLVVEYAECRKCGFVFSKRARFTKPGKCPVCRGESISDPLFTVAGVRSSSHGAAAGRRAASEAAKKEDAK
jgi:transcriptional regulator